MLFSPYIEYDSSNIDRARYNRKNPTRAESILWEQLLRKKQLGYKITRQKALGPFIVDFYCSKLLLAIEIDGSSHNDKEFEDLHRTDYINNLGVKVIRFSNEQVLSHLDGVNKELLGYFEQRNNELRKSLPWQGEI